MLHLRQVILVAVVLPVRWRAFGFGDARLVLTKERATPPGFRPLTSPEAKSLDQDLADRVRDLRDGPLRDQVTTVLDEYPHRVCIGARPAVLGHRVG